MQEEVIGDSVGFNEMGQICQILGGGGTKGTQWGIAQNSRKPMIQLGGRSRIIFSVSSVSQWNGKADKSV